MPRLKKKSVDQQRKADSAKKRERRAASQKSKKRSIHNRRHYECSRETIIESTERNRKLRLQDESKRKMYLSQKRLSERKRLADAENREAHRCRLKAAQLRRLKNIDQRAIHRQRLTEAQARRLKNEEQRQIHRQRLTEAQARRLKNEEQRQIHRQRLTEAQAQRLLNPEKRANHRSVDSAAHRRKLLNPQNRQDNLLRLRLAQKKRLSVPEKRQEHRARLSSAQEKRLSVPEKRQEHRARLSSAQKKRLSVPEKRQEHRARLSSAQKKRLSAPEKRQSHLKRLRICQNRRLRNPLLRLTHLQRLRTNRKIRSLCQSKTAAERNRVLGYLRKMMKNPTIRRRLLRRDRLAKRREYQMIAGRAKKLRQLRLSSQTRKTNRANRKRENMVRKYNAAIKEGPCHECWSCSRLWFKSSIKSYEISDDNRSLLVESCFNKHVGEGHINLCSTCINSIRKGRVPVLSLANTMLRFPDIPPAILKLSPCEERFLCPRLPFMQIREVYGKNQYSVRGRAVNIPTDVDNSVKILPRTSNETATVPIALKRKKSYRQNYMFEAVRPRVIIEAAKVLATSELFVKEKIRVDTARFQLTQEEGANEDDLLENEDVRNESSSNSPEQSDVEEEQETNIADMETLLQSEAIVFAPGEGQRPLSLFTDEYVEAKSFIKIYAGKLIQKPDGVSYQNWMKSEIMRADRRCAENIPKLFFSALKLRTEKITKSIGVCLRKGKAKTRHVTAAELLDENRLNDIFLFDSGFRIFASDRGSPAFFEEKKKEVFAMLRQNGPATFFITLSPAETKWPELLVILKRVVDGHVITEDEAIHLPYEEKARLIRKDPVTCARYFDYRVRKLLQLLKEKESVFREHPITDSYFRVEFQQRGSPHVHGLLWLKSAPVYQEDGDDKAVVDFIDRFLSIDDAVPEDLLNCQTHRHTFTCYKGQSKDKKCRFDIPFFPMQSTTILRPLTDADPESVKNLQKKRENIQAYLTELHKEKKSVTYTELLEKFEIDQEEYFKVIRSTLKRATVFLRRKVEQCFVNPFNKEILLCHRANMDLQFILEVYSCASYVLNYLNKASRGLSRLLQTAVDEVKRGNLSLIEQFRTVANRFLNASEFSAQEAVYYILGMALSKASRKVSFINTSSPEKRVVMTKSRSELETLPGDSSDIFAKSIIDHYTERPEELDTICLAQFCASYNFSKNINKNTAPSEGDEEEEDDDESDIEEGNVAKSNWLALRNGAGFVQKRRRMKVIRYVRFNRETNEDDFYREHLMLFTPWRNEKTDLLDVDKKEKFLAAYDIIRENKKPFVYSEEHENALLQAQLQFEESEDAADADLPQDCSTNEFQIFGAEHEDGDILVEMEPARSIQNQEDDSTRIENDVLYPVPHLISDEEFDFELGRLNEKQRKYLLHVLHRFKTNKTPIFECILGGGGVGKSRVILAIQQCLLRHFNKQLGASLELQRVLLSAFTGKSSFNIRGLTLHSAFVLPAMKSLSTGAMPQLSSNVSNSIYSRLHELQLLIIDEVSMVGSRLFGRVDTRMRQIFKCTTPFGGKSVICFGDFDQLGPIGDGYIFSRDTSNPYGPLIGNPLWEKFRSFELTEIMRQKDDAKFAEALNKLKKGQLDKSDVQLFQSRETDEAQVPSEALRLYLANKDVDSYNEKVLSLQETVLISESMDRVHGTKNQRSMDSVLRHVRQATARDCAGLPATLKLSVNLKYMMTLNVDLHDGLVNGAVGVLKHIEVSRTGDVTCLWFLFSEDDVGKNARRAIQKKRRGMEEEWTPVSKQIRKFQPYAKSPISVYRKQFPTVPAEAITIAKSQSGTYPSVAVAITKGLTRRALYTALSRCTSLAGLYIVGKFREPRPLNPYDPVLIAVRKLMAKPIVFSCRFTTDYPDFETILFHNVQSFKAHQSAVIGDKNYTTATLIILVESWQKPCDDVLIPGYQIVLRQDVHRSVSHAFGMIIYCQSNKADRVTPLFEHSCERKGEAHNLAAFTFDDWCICCGYIPPSTPFGSVKNIFAQTLDHARGSSPKIIVLGDFNQNLLHSESLNVQFRDELAARNLKSRIKETDVSTDAGTLIDVCFASETCKISAGFSESYFSFHKPMICVLNHEERELVIPEESETPRPEAAAAQAKNPRPAPGTRRGKRALKLNDALLDADYVYQQLRAEQSLVDISEPTASLTAFFRQSSLYNQCHKHSTNHDEYFLKVRTTGDGSCFYHAICLLLFGTEALTTGLRALVSAHMIYNEFFCEQIKDVLQDDITWKAVLDRQRYAESAEILITANILSRNIEIYEAGSEAWYRVDAMTHPKKPPLRLLLIANHYSALKEKKRRHLTMASFQFPRDLPPFRIITEQGN